MGFLNRRRCHDYILRLSSSCYAREFGLYLVECLIPMVRPICQEVSGNPTDYVAFRFFWQIIDRAGAVDACQQADSKMFDAMLDEFADRPPAHF